MKIITEKVGKRFQFEWIFRDVNLFFDPNQSYAIIGSNGSGKSTFLKLLAGIELPSHGKIRFEQEGKTIDDSEVFRNVAYVAPYLELIEEFTLAEIIDFHFKMKNIDMKLNDALSILGLEKSKDKQLQFFSSGMKQRVKLFLAVYSNTPILFLDEPTVNLDQQGCKWYLELVQQFVGKKTIIISSNEPKEYHFCSDENVISILDYKKNKAKNKTIS